MAALVVQDNVPSLPNEETIHQLKINEDDFNATPETE